MEKILLVWNCIILLLLIVRELQNYNEKKDLMNRIMAKDYTEYAKFNKTKKGNKSKYPAIMTSEQMINAENRSKNA